MQAHPPVSLTILAAASLIAMATSAIAQESTATSTLPTVTVTGTPDDYRPPNTSTATRTDTPSLQTSQSVQVVPRAVIEDQNALTLTDAVRNVSGVQYDFGFNGSMQPLLILRGFPNTSMTAMGSMSGSSSYYLDGSKVMGVPINMANVQSVEVVKGPASVLYGRSEPGGLVNVVTKPISSVSELSFEQTIGQRGLSRTAIEASGSVYNPSLGNTPGLDPMMSMPQDYDDHSRWTSFYVQDQLALGNGVFLTGALRHDRTNAVFGMPGTEPNKQSFTTPRLGAVWQFAPNQSIYAQYQDSVAANNGRDAVTGAALDSERARQIEIGHKIELFDGKLSSTVALFELTKRNRGATVPDPLSPTLTNVVTIGKAVARGLEWDVSGQLTKKLSLIGSYAYTDAKVTEDPTYQGMRLANVARHTASLWARYAVDSQWAVGGGVFAQSQRQGDSGNTFQLPGYARADAMVAYRFALGASKASLQFNLDNVFNRKYYTGSHQFLQDWIKLGNPRTAKLTLRVDY